MKTYVVKSIFGPTLQGEGSLSGKRTLFVRFTGCNAWDGREQTKAASLCPYCDTDFLGGERMSVGTIVNALKEIGRSGDLVTLSGGEPTLQVDTTLVLALMDEGFTCAIETNGTRAIPRDLRALLHVTMSPKVPREQIALEDCDDLKVLVPHPNPFITPEAFATFPAKARWIQPVNQVSELDAESVRVAVEKTMALPGDWRLSMQLHKIARIP